MRDIRRVRVSELLSSRHSKFFQISGQFLFKLPTNAKNGKMLKRNSSLHFWIEPFNFKQFINEK
jgi:hypothetical protein